MSIALRTFALTIGTLYFAACSNDKRVTDVLAEDSTLAREVMSAKPDSIEFETDSTPSNTTPSTSIAAAAAPIEPEPQRQVIPEPAPTARRSSVKRSRNVRRSVPARTIRVASAQKKRQVSRASTSMVATPPRVERTPLKSSALLPAGTELFLTADQRICASMSRVGDTFATRTAVDVVGPIGVVIPKGTPALAQIASVRKDLDVDMMSIAVQGHSYTLASDVTHTEVERVRRKSSVSKSKVAAGAGIGAIAGGVIGGNPATTVLGAAAGGLAGAVATRRPATQDHCVPEGGRIDVKLTEPLRVSLSE